MGNLVKLKLAILFPSILVVLLMVLLQNNFYMDSTLKRWNKEHPLTQNDFQGVPRWLTGNDLSTITKIALDYDSSSQKFFAYAVQDKVASWSKLEKINEDLLEHEQYHFNITEFYARLLNQDFSRLQELDAKTAQARLQGINLKLKNLQNQYDRETNYRFIPDQQSLWEFKIDSMLWANSEDKERIIDLYTGVSLPAYRPCYVNEGLEGRASFRQYRWEAYDMMFGVKSYHYPQKIVNLEADLDAYYESLNLHLLNKDAAPFKEMKHFVYTYVETESNYVVNEHWVNGSEYLYKLYVSYPNVAESEGYKHIARSFVSGLEFVETDSLLVEDFNNKSASKKN